MLLVHFSPECCIGDYEIREPLGEGGMGIVYLAEQTEPVRRKVALKIIRPGIATSEVVARFEAERQALALMTHPHIARVFDGGLTESGQPYLAMELVEGPPITDYCDRQRLDTSARLQLFTDVCQAVHHAHQKGIIHRDLKPSNVLVPEIDGKPHPKVIDFGVAKAVGQQLSSATVYTTYSQPGRYAALYESGTGGTRYRRRRHPQRYLLAGGTALRIAHRDHSARQRDVEVQGPRRDAANGPRGRSPTTQHPLEYASRRASNRLSRTIAVPNRDSYAFRSSRSSIGS